MLSFEKRRTLSDLASKSYTKLFLCSQETLPILHLPCPALADSTGKKGSSGLGGGGMMCGRLSRALAIIVAPFRGILALMLTVPRARPAGIKLCLRT